MSAGPSCSKQAAEHFNFRHPTASQVNKGNSMRHWISSILRGKRGGGASKVVPAKPQPEVIQLAGVNAEYVYLKKVKCRSCGADTSALRRGSDGPHDLAYEGDQMVPGTMHDFWTIFCNACGATRELTIAVPLPTGRIDFKVNESYTDEKGGRSASVTINGREHKVVAIPTREEAKKRFAGQAFDRKSIRQEVLKKAFDSINLEKDLLKLIQKPRFILAQNDLNVTEFIAVYFALCMELAKKKQPGATKLTVGMEESVVRLFNEPHSRGALDGALDLLLRGDD